MRVYLGKDTQTATKELTVKHVTVTNPTRRVEGVRHKLFMKISSLLLLYLMI
jgi:hypothetical protein